MNELEQRWRDVGEFIREQRRVGHLSLRKLSEMAGISNPYLSQIERGLRKPSAEILQQIARALEISSETLYVRAGILEERDGDYDLISAIRRDPFINEEQKKTLVHIYQSFAGAAPTGPDAATIAHVDGANGSNGDNGAHGSNGSRGSAVTGAATNTDTDSAGAGPAGAGPAGAGPDSAGPDADGPDADDLAGVETGLTP